MPELPEVETIARELCAGLCGRRITACAVNRPASVETDAPALSRAAFRRDIPGRVVARVWRRAKILIMDLVAGEGGRTGASSIPAFGGESGGVPDCGAGRGAKSPERCSRKTAAAGASSAAGPASATAVPNAGNSSSASCTGDVPIQITAAAGASSAAGPAPAAEVPAAGTPASPAAGTGDAPSPFPAAAGTASAAGPAPAAEAQSRDVLHVAVRLGMSGRLWLAEPGAEPERHTHVIFDLDDGRRLFFTAGSREPVYRCRQIDAFEFGVNIRRQYRGTMPCQFLHHHQRNALPSEFGNEGHPERMDINHTPRIIVSLDARRLKVFDKLPVHLPLHIEQSNITYAHWAYPEPLEPFRRICL